MNRLLIQKIKRNRQNLQTNIKNNNINQIENIIEKKNDEQMRERVLIKSEHKMSSNKIRLMMNRKKNNNINNIDIKNNTSGEIQKSNGIINENIMNKLKSLINIKNNTSKETKKNENINEDIINGDIINEQKNKEINDKEILELENNKKKELEIEENKKIIKIQELKLRLFNSQNFTQKYNKEHEPIEINIMKKKLLNPNSDKIKSKNHTISNIIKRFIKSKEINYESVGLNPINNEIFNKFYANTKSLKNININSTDNLLKYAYENLIYNICSKLFCDYTSIDSSFNYKDIGRNMLLNKKINKMEFLMFEKIIKLYGSEKIKNKLQLINEKLLFSETNFENKQSFFDNECTPVIQYIITLMIQLNRNAKKYSEEKNKSSFFDILFKLIADTDNIKLLGIFIVKYSIILEKIKIYSYNKDNDDFGNYNKLIDAFIYYITFANTILYNHIENIIKQISISLPQQEFDNIIRIIKNPFSLYNNKITGTLFNELIILNNLDIAQLIDDDNLYDSIVENNEEINQKYNMLSNKLDDLDDFIVLN